LRRSIGLIFLIGSLFMLVPMVGAQSSVDATVVPDQLIVRQSPGSGAPAVGNFSGNSSVNVTGREDQDGNGGVWVFASNGSVTGWVLYNYLLFPNGFFLESLPVLDSSGSATTNTAPPAANAPAAPPEQAAPPPANGDGIAAQVLADSNLRDGPAATSARIGGAFAGSSATLTGRNADASWVRGTFGSTVGWISATFVLANAPITNLPVTDAAGSVVAAPATSNETTSNAAPAPVNVAPPLPSGGISGFAYGAHISGFAGTERMSAIGMTWVKVQVRYGRGSDPSSVANIINDAHGRGFRLLIGLVGHYQDVADGGDAYFAEFASFAGGAAALGADAIEVWNEPNLAREWPDGMVDPAMYTRLLALSYNAIKGANPNTLVISGAPAPTGFFGGCSPNGCDDSSYVAGMKAAGAAQYMDCLGIHYNEGIVPPTQNSGDPRSEHYTRYFGGMVNTYYSIMGKPLCFTELGYTTPDGYGGMPAGYEWGNENTIAEQAQWLADAISLSARNPAVRMLIVWNFNYFSAPGASDPAGGYSMVRPDGTCPACDAIAGRR